MFGLFVIEAGIEPRALLSIEGKPVVAETGTQAAEIARLCAAGDYMCEFGWPVIKVQPRRLASDAWKARELGRFADGTYVPLPWTNLPTLSLTADHYAHVSTVDGAKIAYTQDATKGAGDIQTRVKPGRYLTSFYSGVFDAPTIARMAAEFDQQYGESNELLFADTAEEIERVYVNGPHSCMAYAAAHFDSPIHPCRIYAAGDLAVAYMVRGGNITARALCWPAKKLYGRIYGDETRLGDLLESVSFESGDLDGARMLRIEHRGSLVCPYIDGAQEAADRGTHLILGSGNVNGGNQNGLANSCRCSACESSRDEDDERSNNDGEMYCYDYYSDAYSTCERYDEECDADTVREVICNSRYGSRTTQHWGERAIENEAFECEGNGKLYSNDFLVTLADGTQWSQDHFEDNGSVCEGNGACYAQDDMVQLEDGTSWSKDYFADNGVTIDGKLYDKSDVPETTSDTDETSMLEALASYRWRASPYCACSDQLEMRLAFPLTPLAIADPDSDGDYRIERDGRLVMYFATRAEAEAELARRVSFGIADDVQDTHNTSNSPRYGCQAVAAKRCVQQ